jgi:hypothetical protein
LSASVVLLAATHCTIAYAAWPSDPNVNVPLCTAANDQTYATMVSDNAGGAIVAWQDSRGGDYDIYAQRVSAAGVVQWIAGGVTICSAANDQFGPMIVSDGSNGAIITWADYRSGNNYDVYVQRVNAAGVPQWTANGVALCTAYNYQSNPTITSDGSGGAIVTWQDGRAGNYDIYAQRVSAAGVPQWPLNGVPLCTAVNHQLYPAIESDGAGGAIVAWQDYRAGSTSDVYVQRVNAAGVRQWTSDGVALCTAAQSQSDLTIASDGAGGAIVTWDDGRNDTDLDIYAQRVNGVGTPQWTVDGVALCTATDAQFFPTIVSDGAGGAIVTWTDVRNGTDPDIYAQRINATGVPQWSLNGVALCSAAYGQQNPVIASDGMGGAIVTWQDERTGTDNDLFAQRVNAAGVPQWVPGGVALCTSANDQYGSTIASDGSHGAIVAWYDYRAGTTADIYAQNINADGSLGGSLLSTSPLPPASFALSGVRPNPSVGDVRVSFSLPDGAPATLALYDLTGRRIESLSVGALGPGVHVASLGHGPSTLPPGVYCVCLTQGTHRAFNKVALVR